MKNDVKNGYRETPGKGISEKWCKNAFFSPGTVPKRSFFGSFLQKRGWGSIFLAFCIHFYFILSFNFGKNGNKMKWKMV